MTTDELIDSILTREGGYVDHPADKGGPTNRGVTLKTLSEWLGREAKVADLKDLTAEDARSLYREFYVEAPGFTAIADDKIRALIVDSGVNHGPNQAVKLLQKALGLKADGTFGPVTKQALAQADYGKLYYRVCAERVRYYGRIITNNPSQSAFAAGWMNRAAEFVES